MAREDTEQKGKKEKERGERKKKGKRREEARALFEKHSVPEQRILSDAES